MFKIIFIILKIVIKNNHETCYVYNAYTYLTPMKCYVIPLKCFVTLKMFC